MTDTMTDQLKQLSEAATQGDWWPDGDDREGMEWNFHIMHGESDRVCFMSNMGSNRTAESGANATFICALVNAYRAGELIPAEEARAREALAYEVAGRVFECFDHEPEFHAQGMGCGLEDRNITDRYEAMEFGWDQAMERVFSETINPAKDCIRPLTANGATALEQIKQEAREEGKREVVKQLQDRMDQLDREEGSYEWDTGVTNLPEWAETIWEECETQRDAILATLSADTQENSDE